MNSTQINALTNALTKLDQIDQENRAYLFTPDEARAVLDYIRKHGNGGSWLMRQMPGNDYRKGRRTAPKIREGLFVIAMEQQADVCRICGQPAYQWLADGTRYCEEHQVSQDSPAPGKVATVEEIE